MFKFNIAILILFANILFAMTPKELAIAINLSGKQRMLTQKMSKESLLIYLNIDKNIVKQKLKKSYTLFNKTLNGLLNGDKELKLVVSKDKILEAKLKEVNRLWTPFGKHIKDIFESKSLSSKTFNYIDKHNLILLKSMNEAVVLYTKLGTKNSSKLKMANDINLAGKQRMLTQMISKDLLLYKANINPKRAKESLNKAVLLFTKTLKGLLNGYKELALAGTKLPNIISQLEHIDKLWIETKPLIKKALNSSKDIKLTKDIIKKLDIVKFEMNIAVELYTKSLNRQKQVMQLNSIISGFMHKKRGSKHLINLAGKQRMLTQRASKLAIECSYKLREDSCVKLTNYMNLYEKTLKGFIDGDSDLKLNRVKNIESLNKISELQTLLNKFRVATKKIKSSNGRDKEALEYIMSNNINLLKESNNLVTIMVKNSSKNATYLEKALLKIVNIAGRERMLTQKMTKEYLQFRLLKNQSARKSLNKTTKLFEDSLNNLIDGNKTMQIPKVTNKNIKKQLLKVQLIWEKLKPLYMKKLSKKSELLLLNVNPLLLKEMNKAVYMISESTDY